MYVVTVYPHAARKTVILSWQHSYETSQQPGFVQIGDSA